MTPADVAKIGFDAMMRGDGDVVSGWQNKLQSAIALITPADMLAEQHRKMAEPGRARNKLPLQNTDFLNGQQPTNFTKGN